MGTAQIAKYIWSFVAQTKPAGSFFKTKLGGAGKKDTHARNLFSREPDQLKKQLMNGSSR